MERKPDWLRIKVRSGKNLKQVQTLLRGLSLNTVCEEANCPNRAECFSQRTATFMILGSQCTRRCTFCNVSHGQTLPPDPEEPKKVAEAAHALGLRYVVVTSVTRDDLPDGGASHFAAVTRALREKDPAMMTELLIPDLQGSLEALRLVVDSRPDLINHNVETVPRLYDRVRPGAAFDRSLELLKNVKLLNPNMLTKSGLMVGMGEREEEVLAVMDRLRQAGCDFLTVGQYLPPSRNHYPLQAYITPEQFETYAREAKARGFAHVASGPLVRSSYHAAQAVEAHDQDNRINNCVSQSN